MDLLKKIKLGTENSREINWPGTDIKVSIHPLSQQEKMLADKGADSVYSDRTIGHHNVGGYAQEVEIQQLWRAVKDPGTGKLITGTISQFRDLLKPGVQDILADELDSFSEEVSPDPEKLTDDEFNSLMEQVKKNAEETISEVSSIFIARRLILSLVSQPLKQQQDS